MPIIKATAALPPPPPSVQLPEVGDVSVTYYDPSGVAWPLTVRSKGWHTLADGVSGLGAAPVALTADPHPRGGARLRHVQPQPRAIVCRTSSQTTTVSCFDFKYNGRIFHIIYLLE